MARFKVFYEFERDGGASAEQHTQLIEAADFEEAQSKALAELSKPCFIEEYTEMHGDEEVTTRQTARLTRFVRRFNILPDHDD